MNNRFEVLKVNKSTRATDNCLMVFCRHYQLDFIVFYDIDKKRLNTPSTIRVQYEYWPELLKTTLDAINEYLENERKHEDLIKELSQNASNGND